MKDDIVFVERMLNALTGRPTYDKEIDTGYGEDVAGYLVRLAHLREGETVECRYAGITMYARASSTVQEVYAVFERQILARFWNDERARIIEERERIGPRAMRALFGPAGTLVPKADDAF